MQRNRDYEYVINFVMHNNKYKEIRLLVHSLSQGMPNNILIFLSQIFTEKLKLFAHSKPQKNFVIFVKGFYFRWEENSSRYIGKYNKQLYHKY